ncbi:COR domain-containing protein [Pannus brasiliensis CCIBt3594]|uniref:non-specific serine/threonine protein kinase n=1 Tax=Pannus brasiliensis CCIBt3594 TaxID=1427578 RepID=A0AAW9QT36_9CHRO
MVKQGNEAIRNYYSQLEIQGKDYLYEAKMLIVGEGGAGKTTLAHKIEDINCYLPDEDDRTRGISINPHTFSVRARNEGEYRQFDLNVWDFGGQEIYHATHRFFLSKRSLYVLVADNRKDDTDFNYWLNIIELFAKDSPIIIVLNEKDDLKRIINTSELRIRYPDSLKEILSVNLKTQEETDSNKRQQRLKDLETLIRHIEHNANCLPHIGEPVPARWVDVRQAIETDTRDYISRQEFDTICHAHGITNFQDINTLLGYFHDLGIVLHFADHPLLCERVILKPTWATDAIYRLFDDDGIKAKQGRFTREDCTSLWSDQQYQYMQNTLTELMKKFRLVYEIEQTGQLVAPQMLPPNTPDYPWENSNNSLMQFRYDFFMPKGIFWQFVVTMYRYIEDHRWVWKNGVILHYKGTRAEIIENLFDRRIYIRFSGRNIEQLRSIVSFQLDEISESYHKLKYDKMIPCNCRKCVIEKEPHFYEFTDLETRLQREKQTVECKKSYDDVPVANLLKGFDFSSQPIDRLELLKLLTNLVKEQFNDILFVIDPPAGIVPPPIASQSDRVHALLTWAESPTGCKLAKIQASLKRILPESFNE